MLQGLYPSLVMVVNPTLQYIIYEWLVARSLAWRSSSRPRGTAKPHLRPRHVFFLSAVAKLGATLATYPMLVVKNRLQVGCGQLSELPVLSLC
jgi:adenine nucleotide transporter 17